MGEEDDPQKIKKVAAGAYDYENDSRWADYWSNILIPPHLSSSPEVIEHYKRKFYQRYIVKFPNSSLVPFTYVPLYPQDPELVVEPMSATGSSRPSAPSPTSSTSNNQPQSRSTGATARSAGASATTPPPNQNPMRWNRQTVQFSVNAWVLVVALLSILPIIPKHLSVRGYRLSLVGTACSSLYSIYAVYGSPRAWNLQSLQVYLQSIVATRDFITFIYCLCFATSHLSLKLALIPILARALDSVARFLRRNFTSSSLYIKYLEDLCVWVESNASTLAIVSSNAEVATGFLLIISLLSWQRNILQTFMYWQLLKLMYHAPGTSGYHKNVWAKIGRIVNPYVQRYCPWLNQPVSMVQRWWFR